MSQLHPDITEAPSSYVKDRVYGCFFEDDFGLLSRDNIGIDQITFECDYPHQDSTWPHTAVYLDHALAGLAPEERYKITRGNAIRMLGLPQDTVEQYEAWTKPFTAPLGPAADDENPVLERNPA